MKNNYLRAVWILAATALVAGTAYGLYRYFEPVKGIDKLDTDVRLTAEQLLADFEADPEQAEIKYKNKVLEIHGSVTKTEPDSAGGKIIFDKQGKFVIVAACTAGSREAVKALEQNQAVRVKGVYTGYVVIDDMFMIPGEIKIDPCALLP